jgi:hypothetical protein
MLRVDHAELQRDVCTGCSSVHAVQPSLPHIYVDGLSSRCSL